MVVVAGDMRSHIRAFDFATIFIENLHWDRYRGRGDIDAAVDNHIYTLTPIAQKNGVVAYQCDQDESGALPPYATRQRIEREVAKSVQEHIIVYTDSAKTTQVWLWVWRQEGKPTNASEQTYRATQSGTALAQKLAALIIKLDEEVTVLDVVRRVNDGLRKERVTRQFYERFEQEHRAFLNFIEGIAEEADKKWYASLMLNRLMFVYFIQRQGFLDGDPHYLRTRLTMERDSPFLSFYKYFLRHLFHEGLSKKPAERQPHLDRLLGHIPYLNGGLFDVHTLEYAYPEIDIEDEAFKRIFDFFDTYDWHLDSRPLGNDKEINPDVLGYIFEKYINQRQMGAYYTKEDITGYISQNTIIPYLFDTAKNAYPKPFKADGFVWRLLRVDPARYMYEMTRKGTGLPLPPSIEVGVPDPNKRDEWNRWADPMYGLTIMREDAVEQPIETWRECINRREQFRTICRRATDGQMYDIDDLIAANMDIRQFAQDVIVACEDPDLLRAFYGAIERISVLDPTCGSGAFNFAALNVLEPLYEGCLARMESFIAEAGDVTTYGDFQCILDRVVEHPNRRYFIYKSIIMNNLYGVDIMEEAVEICKLRLFLKLASQVEDASAIEPLPDIDFNIRTGNTLVGFATYKEVQHAVSSKIDFERKMERINETAMQADHSYSRFRDFQRDNATETTTLKRAKQDVRDALDVLRGELNRYLAEDRGIEVKDGASLRHWRSTHQPFHWFVEFYGIVHRGGFDVIIGNPPYVEYGTKLKALYQVKGYKTLDCSNLHAFVAERSLDLVTRDGRVGLIVPLPAINTSRMETLQKLIKPPVNGEGRDLYIAAFDERPSSLFTGVDQRLIVEIFGATSLTPSLYTTGINRWTAASREMVFPSLRYTVQTANVRNRTTSVLKVKDISAEEKLLDALYRNRVLGFYTSKTPTKDILAYRTAGGRYWKVVLDHPFDSASLSNKIAYLRGLTGQQAVALISSSTFWWYYSCHFDMYNLKDYMIFGFRFSDASVETLAALQELGEKLVTSLESHATIETVQSKTRGAVTSRRYVASRSKPIMDDIDRVLACHYGFSREELDFIINYDIKFRMSGESEVVGENIA